MEPNIIEILLNDIQTNWIYFTIYQKINNNDNTHTHTYLYSINEFTTYVMT